MARKHPNVLKLRKQIRNRERRAYLTSQFSLIKVGRSVGHNHVPEDAKALFAYRARGNTTSDPWLDRIFPGVTPKPSEWKSQVMSKYFDKDTGEAIAELPEEKNGRKYALDRSDEERLWEKISVEEACGFIILRELRMQQKRISFVFNRQYTMCFFVEVFYDDKGNNSYVLKSKVYGGRDRAFFDFEHDRITWMEFLPLSSLSLVLPRRG